MIQSIRFHLLTALLVLPFLSLAQSKQAEPEVLFQLGGEPFNTEEFNYYFLKNAEKPSADSAKFKVNEYLDLYVNFRLKVKEAIAQGKDQTLEFREEFEGYKKQLAEPYLIQTKLKEDLVKEAYERMKQDVSASHILVKVNDQANPEDTLSAYQKLLGIKERILAGEDFGKIAAKESDDPSARQNAGHLGYFSALQMVYPFETAVYQGETGEIVGPVKTRFGYHLIKIKEKRKARGQVLTAHIMIRSRPDSQSMASARNKAWSVYKNLQAGEDWNEQCKLYSDDMRTKPIGGKLQWFGAGQLVPEFEHAAFSLEKVGDMSEPVRTRFGWHIIQLLDKKGLASFDELRPELEKKVSRDSRAKDKKSVAINKLKLSQGFQVDLATQNGLINLFDSSLLSARWNYDPSNPYLKQTLFTTNNYSYEVEDFLKFAHEKQKKRKSTDLRTYVGQLYNQFEEKSIFDQELILIASNNKEYQMVLDEYRSGILLFEQMEEEVWNKAIADSAGLRAFYEKNKKKKYPLAEHAVVRRFVSKDSTVIQQVKTQLDKSNSELDSLFNSEEPLTLQTFDEKVERGKQDWLDKNWQAGVSVEKGENYFTLWNILEIKPNGFKPLNQIKGSVISDYQNELEVQWLKTLKKKYPIKLNKSVLKKYIEEFED